MYLRGKKFEDTDSFGFLNKFHELGKFPIINIHHRMLSDLVSRKS
mgnify:CR=1 FL=1